MMSLQTHREDLLKLAAQWDALAQQAEYLTQSLERSSR